jgi:hypothetical protein
MEIPMTERRKDLLCLTALLGLMILLFSRILFTDRIVRAPDILNESYWWLKSYADMGLADLFRFNLTAGWDPLINSGHTTNGGMVSQQFLLYQRLILHFIPPPVSVAWFMVLHLFLGGAGVFCCCRLVGCTPWGALLGGAIFALAPENVSLINAGHVMKIATISFAPWAFFCLEKGYRSGKPIWFMTTAMVLAFQFFNTHWQIAYYTCLSLGVYGLLRSLIILLAGEDGRPFPPLCLLGCNLVLLLFFLTSVSISLLPLADWSKDTNRGVQSGANQGKGGLEREEAMSWSLPPEELTGFIIPGFFGLSRQEEGPNPASIRSYYWGRMVFTQTVSYMGLIPWLLLPLPLMFRRDRYTWLALLAIGGGVLFSMGKYTPFYTTLFDVFPGINRFRVPKMIMFIPVMGLALLAARGVDLLREEWVRLTTPFRRYLLGVGMLAATLLLLLAVEGGGRDFWISRLYPILAQPTRYEQGPQLIMQRWNNLMIETAIAAALASVCAATLYSIGRGRISSRFIPFALLILFAADVTRVNDKFLFLVRVPEKSRNSRTAVIDFLSRSPREYRTLPMNNADPMQYATNGIPVLYTSNPVQQRRWQEYLDTFTLDSSMPDQMNIRYLVMDAAVYERERERLPVKYQPVFHSPDGRELVLENRTVLPKAWLVSSVRGVRESDQTLRILQDSTFDPRRTALVESPPPLPLAAADTPPPLPPGTVSISRYGGERIELIATPHVNSLLVLGEKYVEGWQARVDGRETLIHPVNHVLRGIYLTPGRHRVEFSFDPLPFRIGKYLTLASFALLAGMLVRELLRYRRTTVRSEE